MPSVNLAVPHHLAPAEAQKRIQSLITDLKGQFGSSVSDLKESWSENTGQFAFKAMGFPVSGKLFVESSQVRLEADLPFAALPFKGRIERELTERAKTLLA